MKQMKNNAIIILLAILSFGCVQSDGKKYGEQYLGAKYSPNPLGEEKSPDTDPLIRTDAFDCTTFVETVLADSQLDKLNKIRYKNGQINFENRNHFIETDWIYNNSDIVENVSSQYEKTAIRHVVIDKKSWFKKLYNIDISVPNQITNLEYIPYENLSQIDIQTPLIVLFIHDGNGFYDKIGTDLAVVHMGFLMPGNVLRHASSKHGYVMDVDFTEYVNDRKLNKHNIGIVLLRIK